MGELIERILSMHGLQGESGWLVNVPTTAMRSKEPEKKSVLLFLLSYFGLVALYNLSQYISCNESQALTKFLSYLVIETTCLQQLQFPFSILSLFWRSIYIKVLIDNDSGTSIWALACRLCSHLFP